MKKLTVIIPCYNQIELARRSLTYLDKQIFKDFSVTIIDDGGSEDYQKLIREFPNLDITYKRNEKNLGAMANMLFALKYPVETEYKMVLHEDDFLHPQYLGEAVRILDQEKEAVFLGTSGIWFKEGAVRAKLALPTYQSVSFNLFSKADLASYFLKSNRLMFGSIIYRDRFIGQNKFDLESYDVLCDRPFLLDIVGGGTAVILKEAMIYIRDHGASDSRGKDIRPKHLFNLYENYKTLLAGHLPANEFLKFSTNDLLFSFSKNQRISLGQYIREGSELGLIKVKYINPKGIIGIIKSVMT